MTGVLDLTEYAYHADMVDPDRPSLSRSVIHAMVTKSPAHAWAAHPKLNPLWMPEEKKAFDVGTVCHQLLLDGVAGVQVLGFDSWRTNAAKQQAEDARAHGLVPLLQHEWDQVEQMMNVVRPRVGHLFEGGDTEVTLAWEDNGVLCRCRIDWISSDRTIVRDFKTSTDAEGHRFSRGSFFNYGYDIQDALYRRAVHAVFGTDAHYELVVAEKAAPFEVAVFDSAPDTLALANAKIDWALGVWAECLETGVWPGYDQRTHSVTLLPWMEEQWWARFAGEVAA